MRRRPHVLLPALAPALLAAATSLLCFRAAGPTAGLFLGGVAFAALIVPPLVLAERTLRARLTVLAATVAGTSAVWLLAVGDPYVTLGHWVAGTAVLAAAAAAVGGVAVALRSARLPASLAAATAVVLFLLWLAWPIWLSHRLAGRDALADRLTAAHPLLALDGALTALGPPWTERPLMYNTLSVMNQDVPYALPETIVWAVLLHLLIGAAGLALGRRTGDPRIAPATPADA